MKQLFINLIIFSIFFYSCSKNKQTTGKTSFSSTFSFDSDDFLNRDEENNIVEVEDASSTDKKTSMFKPEFANLYNLVRKTTSMEGAIIVSGAPSDYPSGVPEKTDDKVNASLAQLNTDLDEHIKTFFAHSKQLTPTRLKARAAGNVSFNPIASGNENYHVYHISFSRGYAEKYAGSEKKKKEHPEYEKGITIFVPLAKAGETRIGAASLRGSNISNTEAVINMRPDHTYRFNIPGGGNLAACIEGDSVYTVTGYIVIYNLQNGNYDTLRINTEKYFVRSSLELDIDGHIKENVDSLISNVVHNRTKLNYNRSQNGDTPHAKPVTSKEKKVWTNAEIQALDMRQRMSMKEWGDNRAMASIRKYIDPNHAARVFSFDAVASNFERYKSSPCYNTLGFSPLGDLKELERE